MIPKGSTKLDWEVELCVVIGSRARYLDKDKAMSAVAGYCVCNDVSERQFQIERGGQWSKGKGSETFGPIGPWMVTKDEIKDVQKLDMWLDVNGKRMQNGSTRTMIFDVAHVVWYCSQFFVLEPGDLITTGTPPGVGLGIKPTPQFLKAGDKIVLGIQGLGEQRQTVVPFKKIRKFRRREAAYWTDRDHVRSRSGSDPESASRQRHSAGEVKSPRNCPQGVPSLARVDGLPPPNEKRLAVRGCAAAGCGAYAVCIGARATLYSSYAAAAAEVV